ncbi:peptide chain release factor 1 [bacterium]|nr:peptide chain release factor 1 [bacterium]MCI0605051.1 peptide chain release factor 1 [bacterium]
MIQKLEELEGKYKELNDLLSNPEIATDYQKYQKHAKAKSELEEIVNKFRRYKSILRGIAETKELLHQEDSLEMQTMAREELERLEAQKTELEQTLQQMLLPKDPLDEKGVILEIRAGTGGEESALFAAELYRMYTKFAERKGWRIGVIDSNPTGLGGFKEIIANVEGRGVYSILKHESGVHRVQRVPVTEGSGRIHTSAVTVAILPEAEEVEVEIKESELKIDTFCASGPGGQHVNTSHSAVRITHLPTGMVVSCQDERSQFKNRAKALKVLRSRLYQLAQEEQANAIANNRKTQVGSGDRSEKIRTYNFPQNRLTDHRINLTLYQLDRIMEGDLDEITTALGTHFQAEALKKLVTA